MPVTVKPSAHGASSVSFGWSKPAKDAKELLRYACKTESKQCLELLQSSFDTNLPSTLLPENNGFIASVINAYSGHHYLNIRPEDVWFAILTQLSAYINKHAEDLRGKFVAHDGKKELIVKSVGNRYSVDFGRLAEEMGRRIEENVVDPELREWIMPAFSTTTQHDTVIASILMMGAMQNYFSYKMVLMCGLPAVTLLGERSDWELILARLDKLMTFGEEPTQFCRLLRPIVSRFVRTFEDPTSEDVIDFWQRILSVRRQGSGGDAIYSGWITAFCFWDAEGNSLYNLKPGYMDDPILCLDEAYYHKLDSLDVPPGWSKVPVKVDDNGDEFDALMIAGSVGINCTSSGKEVSEDATGLDTMSPETGWWMFEKVSPRAL